MSRKARKFKGFFRPKLGDLHEKKRSSPKFRVIFWPKSEIQSFFPPKIRWSPWKKKGLRQNSEWFFGRNPKFKAFFRPKLGDLQKKKKVFTKIEAAISSNFANSDVWGGAVFEWGGLFSIFHRKSASKAQKACDFAYFTRQSGGSSPPAPPPGYATASSRGQGNFWGLEASRPWTWKCVLEAKDVLEDSTSGDNYFVLGGICIC